MAKEEYVNDFLKKLREQVAETEKKLTPEDLNKKIMNTVRSWWKNESIGYDGFIDKGKSDPEFFAHNFARAGIDLKDGWEYTKQTLRGFIDAESLEDDGEVWREYKEEYIRTGFDQKFRDGFEKH